MSDEGFTSTPPRSARPTWLDRLRLAVLPVDDLASPADRPSPEFDSYSVTRTRQLTQLGLVCVMVTMGVLALSDLVIFRGSPRTVASLLAVRAVLIVFAAVMYAVLKRLGTGPAVMPLATTSFLVCLVVGYGFMGTLGGPDEHPFIFSALMIPFFPGLFRVGLKFRTQVTLAGNAVLLLSYYGPHPQYWGSPNNSFLILFLSCVTVGAVLAGDAFYRLERIAFNQRMDMERHAARLAELNQLKDGFIATVSHELRTPLTAIIGLTESVAENPEASEAPFYLKTVIKAAESLLTIINDILDLAKMKASKLTLRPEPTDIGTLVSDTVAVLSIEARRRHLALDASVPPSLPLVRVDGGRLRQILINLVGNALKFTQRGGIRIVVQYHAATLVLRVEDTGPGVPPDKLTSIFSEFEQLDSSSTRRQGGTGLGLSIVRRLAELMGGTVHAEANLPTGCVFILRVPAPIAGPVVTDDGPRSVAPRGAPQMLLAEDNPEARMIVEAFARQAGVLVDVAQNGEEALWLFAAANYDVVLLDIEMPGKDGYAAARGMRTLERESGSTATPIVALTAHARDDYGDKAREAGFSWHLTKPLRRKDFYELLERCGLAFKRPAEPSGNASNTE